MVVNKYFSVFWWWLCSETISVSRNALKTPSEAAAIQQHDASIGRFVKAFAIAEAAPASRFLLRRRRLSCKRITHQSVVFAVTGPWPQSSGNTRQHNENLLTRWTSSPGRSAPIARFFAPVVCRPNGRACRFRKSQALRATVARPTSRCLQTAFRLLKPARKLIRMRVLS